MERYVSRKEAASACGKHVKTIEAWERADAFADVKQNGARGKVLIGANADGVPVFKAGWSREGPMAPGGSDRPPVRTVDAELVRVGVREAGAWLASRPKLPDVGKDALARGEPERVVAERVADQGRTVRMLMACVTAVLVVVIAAAAYLAAHGKRLRFWS